MPETFTPLKTTATTSNAQATFRAHRLPAQSSDQPFAPLKLPHHNHASASNPNPPATPPKVSLHREGDRITQIDIQCPCGQLFQIHCQY